MNSKTLTLLPFLIMTMLLSSCKDNGTVDSTREFKDNSVSIKIEVPTMDDAIKQVKTHIDRTIQKVMVPSYYNETVTKKKPCDQLDVGCSGAVPGSPYGYRNVTMSQRRCCKPKEKSVYMIKGEWVATYLAPKDEWSVTLEFKDDAKTEQKLSWSISLSPSNGVQVSVGGNK